MKDNWLAGDMGHIDAHNAIASKLNKQVWIGDLVDSFSQSEFQSEVNRLKNAGGTLHLPSGLCVLTDTVDLTNLQGVSIVGESSGFVDIPGVKFVWNGQTDGRPMLNVGGCAGCKFTGFGLFGNALAAGTNTDVVGLSCTGNPIYNGSFHNDAEGLYFQNVKTGMVIGAQNGSDQADSFSVSKSFFYYGPDGRGIVNRSSNALSNVVSRCSFVSSGSNPGSGVAIAIERGNMKIEYCLTALNDKGISIIDPVATVEIIGHHSERENYPIYSQVHGTHQQAYPVTIIGLYAYDPKIALAHLGNSDLQYTLMGAYSTKLDGSDSILVSDNCAEVTIINGTFQDGVKKISDGQAGHAFGYFGPQPAARAWVWL